MHPLKVSLEELYLGTTKKLSLSRNVICSKCSGYVFACFDGVNFRVTCFALYMNIVANMV